MFYFYMLYTVFDHDSSRVILPSQKFEKNASLGLLCFVVSMIVVRISNEFNVSWRQRKMSIRPKDVFRFLVFQLVSLRKWVSTVRIQKTHCKHTYSNTTCTRPIYTKLSHSKIMRTNRYR